MKSNSEAMVRSFRKTRSAVQLLLFSVLLVTGGASVAAPDSSHFYVDVGKGHFPIPSNLVVRAVALEDALTGPGRLVFAKPVHSFDRLGAENIMVATRTRIEIGLSDQVDSNPLPNSVYQRYKKDEVNGLSIERFRVDGEVPELKSIEDECRDRIFVGNYFIDVISSDCELSVELMKRFIYRS